MIIGSHVSFSKEQLLGSVKETLEYGGNTFMFYTGAPQNTIRKEINQEFTNQAYKLMESHGIELKNVICHAPYIINIANKKDLDKWQFSIDFLKKELERCEELGISYLVLHPGSSVGEEKSVALKNIIDALNIVLTKELKCMILLETMALKGTEIGSLEDISFIIKNVNIPLGVCIDTCHLHDAGCDLSEFDKFLLEFDSLIGLEKIKCIHLNDSKNEKESHKDRHEKIGEGKIGLEAITKIINNKRIANLPFYLETPNEIEGYKNEI